MELHARLIEAGRAVFARAGYAGATVDDVIAEAATSRATFYRYFHNKDELFDELSRQCFADMDLVIGEFASLADRPGGPLAADVEAVLDRYRTLHARHGGVIRAWFERDLHPAPGLQAAAAATFERFTAVLRRVIASTAAPSAVDDDVRAALLYLLVERSYYGVSSRWSRVDPGRLAPTLATMVHRAYLAGGPARGAGRLRVGEHGGIHAGETPMSGSR